VTVIAVDPPRTSALFHCVPDVRYLDLHTGEFGLGGGSLSCPQAQNLAMGGFARHAADAVRRTRADPGLFASGCAKRSARRCRTDTRLELRRTDTRIAFAGPA
jgi:hypothetical protein